MVEDISIVNAIDSFVASLEKEQINGKLLEDNSKNEKHEMTDENRLVGLDNIERIIKKSIEMICLGEKSGKTLDTGQLPVHTPQSRQ